MDVRTSGGCEKKKKRTAVGIFLDSPEPIRCGSVGSGVFGMTYRQRKGKRNGEEMLGVGREVEDVCRAWVKAFVAKIKRVRRPSSVLPRGRRRERGKKRDKPKFGRACDRSGNPGPRQNI